MECAGQQGFLLLLLCQQGGGRGLGCNREHVLVVADNGIKWQRGRGNEVC